jgi:asparagine synthase (glutamine-hydrolysing)
MCGICGIINRETDNPVSASLLSSMCKTIIHRGPDDEGVWTENNAGLGARRLSILDVEGGHQPLANEDSSIWAAHNGEIYNLPVLRRELEDRGHLFRTYTDTEILVHSYEEWGLDFVHKLRGMFASAVYDKNTKKLILIRDRMGIKPLHYTLLEDKTLIFGSEIKAVLAHPQVKRRLNPKALDLFLTLEYVPAPLTIFQEIHKLPAAHMLVYQEGRIQIDKYWDIDPSAADSGRQEKPDIPALMDELYSLIKESVEMRLLSDVPLGAFLSGGIDSSAIVGLMQELGASPLKTFSIGFEDQSYNELDHARRIARKFGTDHHESVLRPQALELTEKLIFHLDEPLGDFSIFPTYLVSKLAREQVTVILSGDGGDELFGGYEHYQAQKISRISLVTALQKPLSPLVRCIQPSAQKKGFLNKIQRFNMGFEHPPTLRHFRWMMFFSDTEKKSFYSEDFKRKIDGVLPLHERPPLDAVFQQSALFDNTTGELYLDLNTYLVDDILVKVDRMSMASSLETRVPLLDHKIAEFAFKLPGRLKLNGFTTKWIFKKTMDRLLPRQNIYRRKEGFSIPIKHWLRTELREMLFDFLSPKRIADGGFFDNRPIENMLGLHMEGKKNFSHQLWALLVFEIWKENYL